VLKHPEAQHQKEKGVVLDTLSAKLVADGEGNGIPTPSDDLRGAVETKEEIVRFEVFTAVTIMPYSGMWCRVVLV
jgi:hypothetical protein